MRILVLGGTVFLGRHVVDAALARGHEVTIFTRGRHGTGPEGVEHVTGDRADVAPLQGRAWDAAIDTSGYDPAHVAASARARRRPLRLRLHLQRLPRLARQAGRRGLADVAGRRGLRPGQGRRRARRAARGGAVVRAGLIVGPHDNVFRLPVVGAADRARAASSPRPGRPGAADADHRRARPRGLPARPGRAAHRAARSTAPAPIGQTTMARAARGRRATPTCAGSRTTSSRRPASSRGWSCRCGCPSASRAPGTSAPRRRRRPGCARRPVAETVDDIARWLENGGEARAGRLARRAPPAADERRARGCAIPTSVLGIRRA